MEQHGAASNLTFILAISPYVAQLRERAGASKLLLPSVTAIIYGSDGEILLVRQRDGDVWSTPGGSIEPDETPVDAVVRETCEETGLLVEPVGLLGVFGGRNFIVNYSNGDETQYVMTVFECLVVDGQLAGSTEETTECRFVSEAEFLTLKAAAWTRQVLPLCYSRPGKPIMSKVTWTPSSQ